MVLPLLAGLGIAARFALPKVIPRILPTLAKVGKFFAAKPFRRIALPLFAGGFLLKSPTAREAIFRSPTSLVETGGKLGTAFETRIESEKPETKSRKALAIGGTAGLLAAGAFLGIKEIKKRRAAAIPQAAAVTVPTLAAPTAALVPSTAGALPAGALPAAIEAPGAIKEAVPKKRPRRQKRVQKVPSLNPVFINQIQVSTE